MYAQMLKEAVCPLEEAAGGFPMNIMPAFLSDLFGVPVDKAMVKRLIPPFLKGLRAGLSYQDISYDKTTPTKMDSAYVDIETVADGEFGSDSFKVKWPKEVVYDGTTKLDTFFIAKEMAKKVKGLVPDVEATVRKNLAQTLVKYRVKILPAFAREVEQGIIQHGPWDDMGDEIFEFGSFGDGLYTLDEAPKAKGQATSVKVNILPKLVSGHRGMALPVDVKVVVNVSWDPKYTSFAYTNPTKGYYTGSGGSWKPSSTY